MWFVWFLIWLVSIILLWATVNHFLWRNSQYKLSLLEMILYSFLLWFIIHSIVLFLIWWIGIPFSWLLFYWYTLLIFICYFFLVYMRRKNWLVYEQIFFKQQFSTFSFWKKSIIIIISLRLLVKLFFWAVNIFSVPTYQDDTFVNWNYRTKVFFYRESLVLDPTDKDFLWQWYKQYPLWPYLPRMYVLKLVGEWHEWYANIFSFLFFCCSLLLIFLIIYRLTSKIDYGLGALFLLSHVPLYYIHGTNPYFDLFLSVYFLMGVYMCYLYSRGHINWIIFAVYISLLWFTKSEWLIIYISAILWAYLIYERLKQGKLLYTSSSIKKIIRPILVILGINLPFIVFKLLYWLWFWNGNASVSETNFIMHREIFPGMYRAFFQRGNYGLLFHVFVLLWVMHMLKPPHKTRKPFLNIFFLSLLIAFSLVTFIYLTTFTYQYVVDQTWVNRSMMQMVNLIVVVIVLRIYSLDQNDLKI